MSAEKILVSGGGITGLASALAIARSGRRAIVLEREKHFQPFGAGLQLGPNAVRALQHLNAWDAIAAETYQPPEIHIRDGRTRKLLQRVILGVAFERRFGAPYRVAHRAALHEGLAKTVQSTEGIDLHMDAEVMSVANEADAVVAKTDSGNETGSALIAADGIHSPVRRGLFPAASLHLLGNTIYRNLIAMPAANEGVDLECVNLWLLPGGHVVHYPVGKKNELNIVVVTKSRIAAGDWSMPAHPNDIAAGLGAICSALSAILSAPSGWKKWAAASVTGLSQWNIGNICLVGDAAHGTVPYLAQGAAMGLEDAVCLGETLKTKGSMAQRLQQVFDQRKSRASRLDGQSQAVARIYHANPALALARNALMQMAPSTWMINQLAWIYDHQPDTITPSK